MAQRKSDNNKKVEEPSYPKARPYFGLFLIILIPTLIVVGYFFCIFLLARLQWTGNQMGLAIGLVTGLIMIAAAIMRAVGKRLRIKGENKKSNSDARRPVLYLRSFQDDQTSIAATDTREEHLSSVLEEVGPVIAIGRPGDRLAPLGAERRYLKDEDWQQQVEILMSQASFVVIQVGATAGLLWELGQATKRLKPEQLLISLRSKDGAINFFYDASCRNQYDSFRTSTSKSFEYPLPDVIDGAAFLCFERDWRPRLLRPKKWEPYNLSPTAKIRETIRPFFEGNGIRLSRSKTMVQGILMSLLLILCILIGLGGLIAIIKG